METFFMQVFNGKFYLKVYLGTRGISYKKKKIKYWLVCRQLSYQKSLAQKGFAELRAIPFIISPRRQGHLSKFCWMELWQEMQIDITAQKTVYEQLSQRVLIIKSHILLSPKKPRWNLYGPPWQQFCIKWEVPIPTPNEPWNLPMPPGRTWPKLDFNNTRFW